LLTFFNLTISFVLFTGLVVLTGLVIYLWFFAITFFVNRKHKRLEKAEPQSRFVFVVPAHNEESGITATVQSLLSVSYPSNLFDVVVIADNCSDKTAEKARAAGAKCLERQDANNRGKGYALSYAFTEMMSYEYDMFVVIDADSIVSSNFLSDLDSRLRCGEQVVQAYYGMSNPDASILTYLFQVGNLIENKLFWEPKQAFGLPIILRGNGMCFAREILEQYPWNAFSIVEDTEYGLMLINNGIRIHFAPEIGVFACQPETLQQAFDQRVRWASGNATLTKGRAVAMIFSGVKRNCFALTDLGISLIAGSRPLLLVANIVLLSLTAGFGSWKFTYWAGALLMAQVLYIGLGVLLNGFSFQKMGRLVLSPFFLAWLCLVSLLGLAGFRNNQWIRTSRS
jgi:1,2-diacylglycerol 3-beta-glucosyltransferase